jgi:hypothetical protein
MFQFRDKPPGWDHSVTLAACLPGQFGFIYFGELPFGHNAKYMSQYSDQIFSTHG